MSIESVLPYFRTAMNALGHTEWTDAFNFDNIPSTILNRRYHLKLMPSNNVKQNQDLIEMVQPVQISLFVKGFRNTADGRDTAVGYAVAAIKKILQTDTRLTSYSGIKNVIFQGSSFDELSQDNDNVIRATLNFNCILNMAHA